MNLATWKSIKSPVMQEIRQLLKVKPVAGEPTPSRKVANRTWREDILGILSDEQKKADKAKKQERSKSRRYKEIEE